MSAERIFEVLLIVLGVMFAVVFGCAALAKHDWTPLLAWLAFGVPSVVLAACSWCVRRWRFAGWVVMVCWLLLCVGVCWLIVRSGPGSPGAVLSLFGAPASTILSGFLAVLTARRRNGWRLTLWSGFSFPLPSAMIGLPVLFLMHGASWFGVAAFVAVIIGLMVVCIWRGGKMARERGEG